MAKRLATYGKTYSREAWVSALSNRTPFRTSGALRGGNDVSAIGSRLEPDVRRTFEARQDVIDFVVYSYDTPIAWHDTEAGWVIPDTKYSRTTSQHQRLIQSTLAIAGLDYQAA